MEKEEMLFPHILTLPKIHAMCSVDLGSQKFMPQLMC